jgi:hypothetical protein
MRAVLFLSLATIAGCFEIHPMPRPDGGGQDAGPPPLCHAVAGATSTVSRVLLADQPLTVTLRANESSSCACRPRVAAGASFSFVLEACDCCETCDCIDPGYEASVVRAAPPPGDYELELPGGARPLAVREGSQCRVTGEPTGLRVVGPSPELRTGEPRIWWAAVSGEEWLCCVPPLPAVSQGIGPMGEIALTVSSCVTEDCACVPPGPTPFEAWHALGEIGPGVYTVVAGRHRATITVE